MCLYHFACRVAVAFSFLAGASVFAADVAVTGDIQKCKTSDRYHNSMAAFHTCDNALKQKDLSEEDRAELLLGRGEAAYYVGRFDLASWDLDEAIKLNPNLNEAYLRRAWTRMRTFKYPGALHDLSNLLGQDPDNIDALFAIGFFTRTLRNGKASRFRLSSACWNLTQITTSPD
jgi:lipoprotein NlpI